MKPQRKITDSLTQSISQLSDHCVKCGHCLPHCPTYQTTLNEAESPRGRLSLIQGLMDNQLSLDKSLLNHLDSCLVCRRCEKKCPSKVQYGLILDKTRQWIRLKKPKNHLPWLESVLTTRSITVTLSFIFYLYSLFRLRKLVCFLAPLLPEKINRFNALLPFVNRPAFFKSYYAPQSQLVGKVALFGGCVNTMIDAETLKNAIKVLNAYGYGVMMTKEQNCCGAIALHKGEFSRYQKLAKQNIKAFNKLDVDAVLTLSSACGLTLLEYSKEQTNTCQFSVPILDICDFLYKKTNVNSVQLKSFNKKISIFTPCSAPQFGENSSLKLLERLPALELLPLSSEMGCCGAAGTMMIENPDLANNLGNLAVKRLNASTHILAINNIGCAIHLHAILKKSGLKNISVKHPVSILADVIVK